MNVFFRVDASIQIGSGHVMRCLTLARKLKEQGAMVSFICRDLEGNLSDLIAQEFKVYRLPRITVSETTLTVKTGLYDEWLGVSWELDAAQTRAAIESEFYVPDWLIVDHYGLDQRWESYFRNFVRRIMVIDDLASRPHDCELLLDQNFYRNVHARYQGLVPETCKLFLGPRYALLRPEFEAAKKRLRKREGRIRRVLVFFGGSDPSNETLKALEALAMFGKEEIEVDVVVGSQNQVKEEIKEFCLVRPNMKYHCQVINMAEFIIRADLAIGAGGATTIERMALGLPTISIIIAENQRETIEDLAAYGGVINLGWYEQVSVVGIINALKKLFANFQLVDAVGLSSLELNAGADTSDLLLHLSTEG